MFSIVLSEGSLPGRFLFCGRSCFSEVSHPQQYSIATRDTVIPMNTEVPTKHLLSHDARNVALEIRLHSENPMLYRPALHGNWNALSLARRVLKDKFPTPTVPLTAVLPNRRVFLPDPVQEKVMCIHMKSDAFISESVHILREISLCSTEWFTFQNFCIDCIILYWNFVTLHWEIGPLWF